MGEIIFLSSMITNRFFSQVVRIQSDRDQVVCKDGLYKYIRHPGYVGCILFSIGPPIFLGSNIGLLVTMVTVALMLIRTELEDRMLGNELKGYKEFQKEVKYKLIPGVY